MVEPLPRWAKVGAAAVAAAGLLTWIAVAVLTEDSPWCDDGNAACPEEVLVHGEAATVHCIVGAIPVANRVERLQVKQQYGPSMTGWALEGVPTSVLIELEGPTGGEAFPCKGTWVAVGPDGSARDVDDIVAGLSAW